MSLDITPLVPAGRQMIESYGGGGFRIAGVLFTGSVLVLPKRTLSWTVASVDAVTEAALAPVFDLPAMPEILAIGCGARFLPPSVALRAALKKRGLALEWMDTGAACRTFNVLLAEDRSVAAALIAVE